MTAEEHKVNEDYRLEETNKAKAVNLKLQVQEIIAKVKACQENPEVCHNEKKRVLAESVKEIERIKQLLSLIK